MNMTDAYVFVCFKKQECQGMKQQAIIKVTSTIVWGPGHKSATRAKMKVKCLWWPTVTTWSWQRKRERDQMKLWWQSMAHKMMWPWWQPRAGQEQNDELLSIHKCPTRIDEGPGCLTVGPWGPDYDQYEVKREMVKHKRTYVMSSYDNRMDTNGSSKEINNVDMSRKMTMIWSRGQMS